MEASRDVAPRRFTCTGAFPHRAVSHLVTSPDMQRVVVYEGRVAAPLQPAQRSVSLCGGGSSSIHPGHGLCELSARCKDSSLK